MEEVATPQDIECGDQVFDISFHPENNILAAGLITGEVEVWQYGNEIGANKKLVSVFCHDGSCRGLQFDRAGDTLYTISSDQCFRGLDGTGKEKFKFKAHDDKINKLHMLDENLFATGDDSGCVKLWDIRQDGSSAVMEWYEHEDFVSAFAYSEERNTLLSTSGDATIAIYDLKKYGKDSGVQRSDDQEAELTSVEIIKNGKKVVCGTQAGVILTFSWGRWGDCNDRFPGHPETVDAMYKVDESTVLTGSSDGLIRAISLQPNKMIGILGDHDEFPVEGMYVDGGVHASDGRYASHDESILGSFAHDNIIRFNDISMFIGDEDDDEEADTEDVAMDGTSNAKGDNDMDADSGDSDEEGEGEEEGDGKGKKDEDEFAAMAAEDSSDFDSGSSDDEEDPQTAGGHKKLPTATERFYADM